MRRILLLSVSAAAVLFAVAAFAGVGRPAPASGAGAASTAQPSLVTTNGHGDVTAVPDEAVVSAGVNTHAATAAAALSQNAQLMQQVIAALKNAGGSDLQTQEVSLNPQTDQQGTVTGYVAQDTVSAKAKIAAAGALIDAAVGAGANTVDGPSLDVSDTDALYRDALKQAVADARAKARGARPGGRVHGRACLLGERGRRGTPAALPGRCHCRRGRRADTGRAGDARCDRRRHRLVPDPVIAYTRRVTDVVFVEIPSGSRNKYEWDEELGGIALDRRLFTSMSYPADYGYLEGTLASDGDPLDAIVLVGEPTFPGCRIRVRVVGVFHMADEKGEDEKLICVPLNDPQWSIISDIHDVRHSSATRSSTSSRSTRISRTRGTPRRRAGNCAAADAVIERPAAALVKRPNFLRIQRCRLSSTPTCSGSPTRRGTRPDRGRGTSSLVPFLRDPGSMMSTRQSSSGPSEGLHP